MRSLAIFLSLNQRNSQDVHVVNMLQHLFTTLQKR